MPTKVNPLQTDFLDILERKEDEARKNLEEPKEIGALGAAITQVICLDGGKHSQYEGHDLVPQVQEKTAIFISISNRLTQL
jgi:hypothetical protein